MSTKIFLTKSVAIVLVLVLFCLISCGVETIDNDNNNNNNPKSTKPDSHSVPAKVVDQESDTIITFDPKTYKESMTVIRYTNGEADTIQVY